MHICFAFLAVLPPTGIYPDVLIVSLRKSNNEEIAFFLFSNELSINNVGEV